MNNQTHKLSNFQITAIVTVNIIGVIVLTLPRLATERVLVDGGMATFIAGLLSLFLLMFMAILCMRFPNQTVIEFSQEILGRLLGRIYGVIFALYCILVTGVVLRTFADALKLLLMPKTPLEFIMISMLLVVFYMVHHGISSISKLSEIFLPLIVLSLGLLILLNLNDVELIQLRPMFSRGLTPFIQAIPNLFLVYLGYEVIFFLTPFMKEPKKLLKYSAAGVAIPTVIYTALVFACIALFGVKPTSTLVYPTVILARRIIFPGAFAERFDIFFIIFWILAAFTTIAIFLYLAAISTTRVLGLRNFKPFSILLAPLAYIIAILPQNVLHIDQLALFAGIMGACIAAFSIPLLFISIIRKKGGRQNA